jgi:hypothetical protein
MVVHSAHGPVNSILCTGEILTGRMGASKGYYNLGEETGVSHFATSLA